MNEYSHAHTHTHIHTHANTHAHRDTRMNTSMRSRAPTHTKCSFVIGGASLWNDLSDNVKKVESIEFFK